MKQVILVGITGKGKNRINEYGSCWNVIEERNGRLLLESMNKPGYLKWGPLPDFKILENK